MTTAVVTPGVFAYSSVVLFLLASLAASAGVGGGGIITPILIILYGYSFKRAIVFSSCTLLGSYFSQILVNFPKHHPQLTSRPLVYISLILILLPAQLGGSNIGSILADIFPDTVLYFIALAVLVFASTVAFQKGKKQYDKENGSKNIVDVPIVGTQPRGILEYSTNSYFDAVYSDTRLELQSTDDSSLNATLIVMSEMSKKIEYPWVTIAWIIGMWSGYVALLVSMNHHRPCNFDHWAFFVAIYVWVIIFVAWGIIRLRQEQAAHPKFVLDGDLRFDSCNLLPAVFVFIVGIICSLLGIGGSELVGPMLLSLGVLPQVSAATTSFLSFFTTFAILINYGAKGELDYNVGGILLPIGFVAGFFGRTVGIWFSDTYKRPSFLIFALTLVLMLSCIFYVFELSSNSMDVNISNFCSS